MKIIDIQTFIANPVPGIALTRNWLFVKVTTDDGLHGWGEASLEWRESAVASVINDMARQLIGQDAGEIERLTQRLDLETCWRGGAVLQSAVSGINQALWDLFGKAQNLPVYRLLGGAVRDRIRAYAGVIRYNLGREQAVQDAREGLALGLNALKGAPLVAGRDGPLDLVAMRRAAASVGAVRAAVGDEVDLMLDMQGASLPAAAIAFAGMVEPFGLLFIEEPVPFDQPDGLAAVARSTRTPIAAGEHLFRPPDIRPLLERGAVAIIQPDVCHAGGISGLRRIAALAEAYGVLFAPHNACGPVGTAASLHLAAATTNFFIQELPGYALSIYDSLLERPLLALDEGFVPLPSGPGLGVELREDVLHALLPEPTPIRPFAFRDGSYGGWV